MLNLGSDITQKKCTNSTIQRVPTILSVWTVNVICDCTLSILHYVYRTVV